MQLELRYLFGELFLILNFNLLRISFCRHSQDRFKIVSKETAEKEGHIVGGAPANIEEFPFACIIEVKDVICGGTIINSWTVLTAAHCLDASDDVDDISIFAGSRQRHGSEADKYYAAAVRVHEKYNDRLFVNDIAMIFVDMRIKFGKKVQRAVIVDNDKWLASRANHESPIFTVIGWGMVQFQGPSSELGLSKTNMKITSIQRCAKLHNRTSKGSVHTEDIFCLYSDGTNDFCLGDSGTGVFWHNLLVGIVSHGDGCAGKDRPSVYTNVYYFRNWVETTIKKYFESICTYKKFK